MTASQSTETLKFEQKQADDKENNTEHMLRVDRQSTPSLLWHVLYQLRLSTQQNILGMHRTAFFGIWP